MGNSSAKEFDQYEDGEGQADDGNQNEMDQQEPVEGEQQVASGMTKSKILAISLGVIIPVIVIVVAVVVGVMLGAKSSSTNGGGSGSSGGGSGGGSSGSVPPIERFVYEYIHATTVSGTTSSSSYFISGPFQQILASFDYVLADQNRSAWFVSNNFNPSLTATATSKFGNKFSMSTNQLFWTEAGMVAGIVQTMNFLGLGMNPNSVLANPEISSVGSMMTVTTGQVGSLTLTFPTPLTGSADDYVIYAQNGNIASPQNNGRVIQSWILDLNSFLFMYEGAPVGLTDFRVNWFVVPKRQATNFSFICPVAFTSTITKPANVTAWTGIVALPVTLDTTGATPIVFAQMRGGTDQFGYVFSVSLISPTEIYYLIGQATSQGSPATVDLMITIWRGIVNASSFTIA